MDVTIKGRGIELTPALRAVAEQQIVAAVAKVSDTPATSVDIELAGGPHHAGSKRYSCRIHLVLPKQTDLVISERDDDLYKAIYLAHDRLLETARKQNDKQHDRHEMQRDAAKQRALIARANLTAQQDQPPSVAPWEREAAAFEKDQSRRMHSLG